MNLSAAARVRMELADTGVEQPLRLVTESETPFALAYRNETFNALLVHRAGGELDSRLQG